MGSHLNFLGFFINIIGFYSNQITYITFIYATYFIYLHYQAISEKKTSRTINIFLFSILQLNTAVSFLLFEEVINKLPEIYITWFSTIIIFTLICSFFILKSCYKTHRLMKENATMLELIAVITVMVSFLFYFSNDLIFSILRYYIWIIGQSLLVINYIIHKEYIFRLSFPVHDIYIINRSGLLVYHRHVSTRNIPALDESKKIVISGAIKAISVIVSEILGSSAKLKLFDVDEYKMYFSELKGRDGIIIVITSGNNYYLQKSIKNFSKMISDDIIQRLNQPIFNNNLIFKKLDGKLQKAFPYLVLIKENKE
ncbi:MAG: hypothetical protein ACFFBP_17350 [Promethearchaeota archaeon]